MTPARWAEIKEVFGAALETPKPQRPQFLESACGGDADLRAEVERMLAGNEEPSWQSPAAKLFAVAAELAPGDTVAHYRIEAKLGEGGMGVVYKVRDSHLKRFVALKVLPPERVTDPERKQRFIQEARSASALNHPNIVTVYDIDQSDGIDFIAMEYVEGKTLDESIGRKGLKLNEALQYAIQIADAMARAHAAGIVHRDLKPGNVMVTGDGRAKVLDFGLAKLTETAPGGPKDSTLTEKPSTELGLIVGTAAYMSPEQAEGKKVDARSDIFSFGSLLYEMLTGRRAFRRDSQASTLAAILHLEPAPLPAGIPQELEKVITRCLRKDPAHRFQHIDDVKVALEELKEESDSVKLAGEQGPARPRNRGFPRSALAAAAFVVLVTAGLLVTGLWPVPVPRVRVTQLTHGGRLGSAFLAVHGGRILYTSQGGPYAAQFWSIPADGGEPRRERMPFLNPEYPAWLIGLADWRSGAILLSAGQGITAHTELWLAGFDGSKPRLIGEAAAGSGYSVSPDLKTLLRSSKEGLFARPVDGGPERLVARVDWNAPSYTFWHPSGERIGFLVRKDRSPMEAWEVKTDGTGKRPLLPQFHAEQYGANWSPDGKQLYFLSQGEVYVRGSRRWLGWMRRPQPQRLTAGSVSYHLPVEDPTDPRVIYAGGSVASGEAMKLNKQTGAFEPYLGGLSADCLDYSPDGQWIAYVSYPARELWKCRRDGSDKVLLEDGLLTHVPRWSPDGKRLVFSATRKGVLADPYRIYIIPAAGGRAEPVKSIKGPGSDPNWSPDGKKLVFAPYGNDVVPKEDRHVSIMDLETGQVQMVPGSENMFSPRWSPDGKHLVTLRYRESGPATYDDVGPAIYDFETQRWADVNTRHFVFPTWSKDSKYVYGMLWVPVRLARIEVATRRLEEIRSIKEFQVTGTAPGVSWTPDGEPVVLADQSTWEIYRLDVER